MDEELERKLKWRSDSDQFRSASGWWAADIIQRRAAFIEAGIPPHLADSLIRDMHFLYTCKGLWPDTPPSWAGKGEEER